MTEILLDMNRLKFQKDLFSLEKIEQRALLNTLNKIKNLTWNDLYKDKGIRWERITSLDGNVYSFRFSKKYRGTAYRDGDYLVLVSLHADHDSAYE